MISKIEMKGVACYKQPTDLCTDKKNNIVYGLNGTGKSTISNFLYDPNETSFEQCSVDAGNDDNILVYNQQFIRDYFYETDSLRGVFNLSKENTDIEQKLVAAGEALDSLIERSATLTSSKKTLEQAKQDDTTRAAENTWEIRRQYSGGDRVLEYCLSGLMGRKESLFNHVYSVVKPDCKPLRDVLAIKNDVNSLSSESSKPYDQLPKISFDQVTVETNNVFAQVIVGNENSSISKIISQLDNSDWVRAGMQFLRTPANEGADPCPFCQERTITRGLAQEIRSYFDEAFDDSVYLVASLLHQYERAYQQLMPMELLRSHPLAETRLAELTQRHTDLNKIVSENLATIRKKKLTPSAPVYLESTSAAVADLNDIIDAINIEVANHNERLENVDSELSNLKNEFWTLMRWEYDQTIRSWIRGQAAHDRAIAEKKSEIDECSAQIEAIRTEIAILQKSTVNVQAAVDSINVKLDELGITSFSIESHAESRYRIVRSEESAAEFSSLSEGEKMIISFLYFCEICKGKRRADETIGKKIIVIDDPISSLSHIYVFNIAQLIKREFFISDTYEQVFVLTHSLYFFYELADNNHDRRKETQKLFRLTKNTGGSSLKNMKYEEVQNDYQSYWTIVTDRDQPPALIANCMRNIVEYFFNFVQKADFSNVIQKPELQDNRYQAFCRYINRESHSLGQNIFDFKEFDYDDFRDGLRLVFEVTGYPEHYQKMIKVFSNTTT